MDNWEFYPQTWCGCESGTCDAFHGNEPCPAKVDKHDVNMLYVGKVCLACAKRISATKEGRSYLSARKRTDWDMP